MIAFPSFLCGALAWDFRMSLPVALEASTVLQGSEKTSELRDFKVSFTAKILIGNFV